MRRKRVRFSCMDSSAAPMLDVRRRLKVVMDVLDVMISHGVSLARSVELTVQWDGILRVGPIGPVTREDFQSARSSVLGERRRVWEIFIVGFLISFIGSLFIAGMRLFVGCGICCVRILWFTPTSGSGLIWCLLLLFCSVNSILLLVVLGFLPILLGLMRNSEKPGFSTFVALGKGRPALRNSLMSLKAGCPCLLRYLCLDVLGSCLLRLYIVRVLLLVAWMAGVGGN